MGGTRNLKLGGGNVGARAQGGNNFLLCGPNVDLIQLLCAPERCSTVQGQQVAKPL